MIHVRSPRNADVIFATHGAFAGSSSAEEACGQADTSNVSGSNDKPPTNGGLPFSMELGQESCVVAFSLVKKPGVQASQSSWRLDSWYLRSTRTASCELHARVRPRNLFATNLPASHPWHLAWPGWDWCFPAWQSVHAELPANGATVPELQFSHDGALVRL